MLFGTFAQLPEHAKHQIEKSDIGRGALKIAAQRQRGVPGLIKLRFWHEADIKEGETGQIGPGRAGAAWSPAQHKRRAQ